MVAEDTVGQEESDEGIAQKLQTLVIGGGSGLVTVRWVRESGFQQSLVFKIVTEGIFECAFLRGWSVF